MESGSVADHFVIASLSSGSLDGDDSLFGDEVGLPGLVSWIVAHLVHVHALELDVRYIGVARVSVCSLGFLQRLVIVAVEVLTGNMQVWV